MAHPDGHPIHELIRALWAVRHHRDRKFRQIVRALLHADLARLRNVHQVTK